MVKSMANVLKEQGETRGKQDAVLKLLKFRFPEISQDISNKIASIHNISSLDSLFEKAATAQKLDDIDWNNYVD